MPPGTLNTAGEGVRPPFPGDPRLIFYVDFDLPRFGSFFLR